MRNSAAADRLSVMTAYRKILVGYDDSEQARDALALGRQLADVSGAALVVGGIFPLDPIWGSSVDQSFRETEANYARRVKEAARAVGAEADAYPSSSAARGLHNLAEEIGADLIVVGSSHRGRAGQALAGGVGTTLLHGAGSAVAVASRGFREEPAAVKTIVVGFDGSAEAGQALVSAWQLAKQAGATLKLISVAVPPPLAAVRTEAGRQELLDAIRDAVRDMLTEARNTVPDGIELETTLITGDPVEALKDVAGALGTILVVGSRGYGPLRRVLLGSVSAKLVAGAPCPVLVTPRGIAEQRPRRSPGRDRDGVVTLSNAPVLLAYDGSPSSAVAIAAAGRLVKSRHAVVSNVWARRSALDATQRTAAEGVRLAEAAGFRAEPLCVPERDHPWHALLDAARSAGASMVVAGAQGLSGIRRALLGSVSTGLVHHAELPVLVVPTGSSERIPARPAASLLRRVGSLRTARSAPRASSSPPPRRWCSTSGSRGSRMRPHSPAPAGR